MTVLSLIPEHLHMKKTLLILFSICFSISLSAQNTPNTITVKGLTIDSATNKALDFVTVALVDPQTKASVKSMLTKEDGSFELSAPAGKTYQLALAFMGYASKVINITNTTTDSDAGRILLSPSTSTLNEVSISGLKPLVKREVDRIAYNVQSDPESKAITALDMMRKVPMLSVDASDNIKLRGSGSYKILINNKESALMARNPADILKAMPASNILKIEVITTPPAKYDAEGLAGIINIITKKDADQGYNGSVNTGYNTVWGYRSNLNLTVKQGKFGYTGYVGFNRRRAQTNPYENATTFFNPPGTENVSATLLQNGQRTNSNHNVYTGNELSFELDTLNLFTGTFNLYNGGNNNSNMQSTIQRKGDGSIDRNYSTLNTGTNSWKGVDAGINYQHAFKRNKEQLLTLSYKYSNSPNTQENFIASNHGLGYTTPDYMQYNSNGTKEYTTQVDYVHPMKVLTIEGGGKMILRNSFSNSIPNVVQPANNFIYHQDVYGAYNTYLLKYTKWSFKGGLRFERTNVNTEGGSVDQAYNNLVPSFSTQRVLDSVSSLTFGFTQRIQRPSIYQLNPFTDRSNPQYISGGNPNLRPAVNNNFELAYSKTGKGSLNITASYSFANNTIENVATVNGTVTTTTFANVGQNRRLGFNADLNYPITKKLNVSVNAQIFRVWLRGTYNGVFYNNSGQQGYIFTSTTYKFDNGLRIGTNLGFDSRYVMLQGTDNYWIDYSFSVQKELFKGKLNVSLAANDPFKKFIKLDFSTRTPDFQSYNINHNFYRTFNFGLNYKFGGLNGAIKKNQRGISNDDTSSGGRSQ